MKLKYKHIFIDLDDTIWDFEANSKESLQDLFKFEELKTLNGEFNTFFEIYTAYNRKLWDQYGLGKITREYLTLKRFAYPLSKIGIESEELAIKMNSRYLDILANKAHLIPHARNFLKFCKNNDLTISLISNGFVEVQHRKLRSAGIEHYFNHVVLSDDVGALKPDPAIFQHTLQLNQAHKHEVIMIGDSFEADIQGAANFGIDSILINRKKDKIDALPESCKQISCFSEIYEHIESPQ